MNYGLNREHKKDLFPEFRESSHISKKKLTDPRDLTYICRRFSHGIRDETHISRGFSHRKRPFYYKSIKYLYTNILLLINYLDYVSAEEVFREHLFPAVIHQIG